MEAIYSLNSPVSGSGYVCWASCYFLQFISRGVIRQYTLRLLCQETFVIQKSGLAGELRGADEGWGPPLGGCSEIFGESLLRETLC